MESQIEAYAGLIVHSRAPLNAEPPLARLRAAFLTSQRDFYIRSHGEIPDLDPATHRISLAGRMGRPQAFTLAELQARFAHRTAMAVMQCAGNRRADMQAIAPVSGDPWAPGAIGNAAWTGVSLADVLCHCGSDVRAGLHVAFASADQCEVDGKRFRFGASIPIEKAMTPDVLLAWAMNGEAMTRAHGRPIRIVSPGYAGVRSPKWLTAISVQDSPSDNPIQSEDYKLFPPDRSKESADPAQGVTINEMPVNSAICEPESHACLKSGRHRVAGYAIATARRIVRVDVSADEGRTWRQAELQTDATSPWSWTLWQTEVDLPPGEHTLAVRAWDEAGQTQPSRADEIWNYKGYLSAAWHRVPVRVGSRRRMPSPQPNIGPGAWRRFSLWFWLALGAASVATGLAAGLLMWLLSWVEQLAWGKGAGDFLDAVERASAAHRVAVVLGAGILVVATRWLLRLRGSGHGGELAAAIWFRAGHLPALRTLLNAVASIVIVGLGASLGREAAPKQIGALFAGVLARWAGLPAPQRRLLAACGAGAGIAAVYNVPFGGALFALEVLLGTLSFSLVAPALAASLIATACAWLLLPDQPTYHVPSYAMTPQLLAWAAIAGPVLGAAAALYVRLICWADARKPAGWLMFVAPLLAFAALGGAAISFPQLLGNGKDMVQLAFSGSAPLLLALCLAALKPLATAACLGSGAPGGLFTPTLTVGALLGAAGGQAWVLLWPADQTEAGAYALVGAGAFLAASMQGPVSALVLLLELTRRVDSTMVALMLAIAGAMLVARNLEARSTYSGRIHAARAALPEGRGKSISAAARTPEFLHELLARPDSELDVLDQDGGSLGSINKERALAAIAALHPDEILTARDLLSPAPLEGSGQKET